LVERRPLTAGLEQPEPPVDPVKAREFVFGKSHRATEHVPTAANASSPLSTRIRTDYAAMLKNASLDRQMKKLKPSSIRDILEQALEPWLKSNGYLP